MAVGDKAFVQAVQPPAHAYPTDYEFTWIVGSAATGLELGRGGSEAEAWKDAADRIRKARGDDAEAFVRAQYSDLHVWSGHKFTIVAVVRNEDEDELQMLGRGASEAEAWAVAAEFVRQNVPSIASAQADEG